MHHRAGLMFCNVAVKRTGRVKHMSAHPAGGGIAIAFCYRSYHAVMLLARPGDAIALTQLRPAEGA